MPTPARAGGLLYALDVEKISAFYEAVVGFERIHSDQAHYVLASADFQLIIHDIPTEIARSIVIASPPVRRETTALKLFFTVSSLSDARGHAARLGGEIFLEQWGAPGFAVCNACDPEGNIFQVRELLGQENAARK